MTIPPRVNIMTTIIAFLLAVPLLIRTSESAFSLLPAPHINTSTRSTSTVTTRLYNHHHHHQHYHRRAFLSTIVTGGTIIATATTSSSNAIAADQKSSSSSSLETNQIKQNLKPNLTQNEIASFLHPIPSFAIVDQKGVPFMVVGEDAKLSAYFFTTYDEASRILNLASESADKTLNDLKREENEKRKAQGLKVMTKKEVEDIVGINPWKDGSGARISSLPLDFGVSLANRGKIGGSYFKIAPSEEDIEDALDIEKSIKDLAEGKVPLFYIDGFEIIQKEDGKSQIPLYFQKSQLLEEYNKQQKVNNNSSGKNDVVIQVSELFSVLGKMVATGEVDDDLKKLVLVPPRGSEEKAKLCEKKGRTESPYKLGERIVVL